MTLIGLVIPGLLPKIAEPLPKFNMEIGILTLKFWQQDLAIHQSGMLKFSALMPSERFIQPNEGFSVVSVKMHILGSYEGAEIDQHYRFTRVWAVFSAGSLQVIAGHACVVST